MFNLNQASIGIRKAAYLAGVRDGKYEPITDRSEGYGKQLARVVSNSGKLIVLTLGDVEHANGLSWSEIK